ncbi:MAG: type IV pilus assembly protein FimV, partial [Rhodanobacteraceae bacterium]
MKCRFKLTLAIALALGSAPALALQLGEIRVKSSLDEPLVAEIPIQLDNLTEAKDLRVGLASSADFAKAGLTRNGLEHLRFSIVSDSTGHKLVLVTSEQPVGDPYLDFLIEVDSTHGKQLREYTVLLDPVIGNPPPEQEAVAAAMAPQPAAPVQTPAPAAQPAAPAPSAAAQSAPARQPAPPQATPPPASAPTTTQRASEYTVQRGDTLYRIASETRPDDGVSVDQMMLALQSSNPDAFYQPNINNLRSGAILRIPTRGEIDSSPSGSRARAQVHRQYEDWRGAAARNATTVAGNEAPAESGMRAKPAANEGDKLALVPPSQGGGAASTRLGEKGGTGTAEVAGLKQQLATAKESLASAQQENNELQSRVKDLEDIGGKNQKLLGMKDAQIADLQNKLAQMQKGAGAATASSAATPGPAGSASSPATTGTASASGSNTAASAASSAAPLAAGSAPAAVVAPTAPTAKPVAGATPSPVTAQKPASAPQDETPWYQRPVVWIIGAIVIVALILLGLLRRRPKPLPDPEEEPDAPSLADQFGESPLPRSEYAAADELHDPELHDPEVPPEPEAEHIQHVVQHDAASDPVFAEPPAVAETDHDI